tara:strand:+ start:395 stop:568 length:174 start_codon:yes stop_codon:yes gene_type:complete
MFDEREKCMYQVIIENASVKPPNSSTLLLIPLFSRVMFGYFLSIRKDKVTQGMPIKK